MNLREPISMAAVLLGACVLCPLTSLAGTPADGAPATRVVDATGTTARDATGADAEQSRNAARSRMRECGHQWSNMKKNGTASGMTWKDFSQGCLAKQ